MHTTHGYAVARWYELDMHECIYTLRRTIHMICKHIVAMMRAVCRCRTGSGELTFVGFCARYCRSGGFPVWSQWGVYNFSSCPLLGFTAVEPAHCGYNKRVPSEECNHFNSYYKNAFGFRLLRRRRVFQAFSVPGAEELQKLLSVGPEGYMFSKTARNLTTTSKGTNFGRKKIRKLFFLGVRVSFRAVVIVWRLASSRQTQQQKSV